MTIRKQGTRGRRTGAKPARGRRSGPPNRPSGRGRLWLWGHHAVAAALANGSRPCHRILATETALATLRARLGADLDGGLDSGDPIVGAATPADLDRMLPPGAVHQGVALEAGPLPDLSVEEACAPPPDATHHPVIVVLDRVSDPQNVGAVLRAAAAFGARAVIVPDRHTPHEGGTLAKAASGALEVLPLVRVTNLARALDELKTLGYWCLGLDPAAPDDISVVAGGEPRALALVLGAEGAGLRRLTAERCDLLARLPISDAVESLNVAAAAAVTLYAVTRGR